MKFGAIAILLSLMAQSGAALETEQRPALSVSGQTDAHRQYWWTAKLQRVGLMRSALPRDSITVTVVVPLSLERLQPLEFQCQVHRDSGFIVFAGALYIPVHKNKVFSQFDATWNGTDVAHVIARIQEFHNKATATGCILDLALWQEELPEVNDWFTYPNNALRNKAMELAETEVVTLIDADFIFGPINFGNQFQKGLPLYEAAMALLRNQTVLVMPAFDCEVPHDNVAAVNNIIFAATTSKRHLLSTPGVSAFQKLYHENTDYEQWKISRQFYQVPYLKDGQDYISGYEPYILALKSGLPCYDERFRGYYYNKCSFLYNVHRLGYRFAVHPDAYVIHYPHAPVDKMAQRDGKRRLVLYSLMSYMGQAITEGTYKPFVRDGTCDAIFH